MTPDDWPQRYSKTWWIKKDTPHLCRGRLLRAFVPYVDQQPMRLVPTGRSKDTEHGKADYFVEPFDARKPIPKPRLPVAALPDLANELRLLYKVKRRPVLVVEEPAPEVEKSLRVGAASYQTHPTLMVAPYFGVEPGTRGGWKPEFVDRIRHAEYPQYLFDVLPTGDEPAGSILRFDQAQPIGRDPRCYLWSEFCLSDEALEIQEDWMAWLRTGILNPEGLLALIRSELMG